MMNLDSEIVSYDSQRRYFYLFRLEDYLRDLARARVDTRYSSPSKDDLKFAFNSMLKVWFADAMD